MNIYEYAVFVERKKKDRDGFPTPLVTGWVTAKDKVDARLAIILLLSPEEVGERAFQILLSDIDVFLLKG